MQNWQLAASASTTSRRRRAVARPALLVAVGRGAVLPRVAGRAGRRRRTLGGRRRTAVAALMGGLALASLAYSIVHETASDPAAAYFVTHDARVGVRGRRPARACRRPVRPPARRRHGSASPRSRSPPRSTTPRRRSPASRRRSRSRARSPSSGPARRAAFLRSAPLHLPRRHLLLRSTCGTGRCGRSRRTRPAAGWTPPRPSRCSCSRSSLAWLTKLLIEDPHRRLLSRRRAALDVRVTAGAATRGRARAGGIRERAPAATRSTPPSAPRSSCSRSSPPCFAAAARDPEHPCSNPQLRLTVVPTPIEAHKQRNSPCPKLEMRGLLYVCGFGVAAGQGDDDGRAHRRQPRRPLARGARRRRAPAQAGPGVSISHTGCPLSKATKNLPQPRRTQCVQWNRQVLAVVQAPPGGHDRLRLADLRRRRRDRAGPQPARRAAGRLRRRLAGAAGVGQRIVVLRDTPKVRRRHRHVRAGGDRASPAGRSACSVPRRSALSTDSAAIAAASLRSTRASGRRSHRASSATAGAATR